MEIFFHFTHIKNLDSIIKMVYCVQILKMPKEFNMKMLLLKVFRHVEMIWMLLVVQKEKFMTMFRSILHL